MAITAINLSNLDGSNGFRLDGVVGFENSGRAVSNAGDVNGDGFDDVVIGARSVAPFDNSLHVSYVVFGKASGFDARTDLGSI